METDGDEDGEIAQEVKRAGGERMERSEEMQMSAGSRRHPQFTPAGTNHRDVMC